MSRIDIRHHAQQAARWASDSAAYASTGNDQMAEHCRKQALRHQEVMRTLQKQAFLDGEFEIAG